MILQKKTDFGMNYFEYSNPNGWNLPVFIFLHASGERSNIPSLTKIQVHGTPKILKLAGLDYLPGFIMICPQQVTTKWGWVGDPNNPDIDRLIKFVKKNYPGDGRYFVSGPSMGSNGTWDALYSSETITAGIPVSGEGDYNKAKVITAPRNIPVSAFHGSSDTIVPPSDGKRPINGMIAGGANPTPTFTLIDGGGHGDNTWDKVYALDNKYFTPNIYQWMDSQGKPEIKLGIYIDNVWQGFTECEFEGHKIEFRQ